MSLSVEVLVATMNLAGVDGLLKQMHVQGPFVVINQITTSETGKYSKRVLKSGILLNFYERGLSKSRNRALSASKADICVIADDDMRYESGYEDIIRNAYVAHVDADIIAFRVDSGDPRQHKKVRDNGRLNRISSMKVASWQITFRREVLDTVGVRFDENFGAGTSNYMGEENIFLYDCIRKGLKVHYCSEKIATLNDDDESTWFEGYTNKYFFVKGAVYRRMSRYLWLMFILQFLMRKYSIYRNSISLASAASSAFSGARSLTK